MCPGHPDPLKGHELPKYCRIAEKWLSRTEVKNVRNSELLGVLLGCSELSTGKFGTVVLLSGPLATAVGAPYG
jgi:hypothetical protein